MASDAIEDPNKESKSIASPQKKTVFIGGNFYECLCELKKHCCIHECLQPFNLDGYQAQLTECLEQHQLQNFVQMILGYLILPAARPLSLNHSTTKGPSKPRDDPMLNPQSTKDDFISLLYTTMLHPLSTNHALCPSANDFIKDGDEHIKMMFIGNKSVGKTKLISRFIDDDVGLKNTWDDLIDIDCVDDPFVWSIGVRDQGVALHIYEGSSGRLKYDYREVVASSDVIVICISCDDTGAATHAEEQRERVIEIKDHAADALIHWGLILVMTKCDDRIGNGQFRNPLFHRNRNSLCSLAATWNIPYIETSSKDSVNVKLLFEQMVYELWMQRLMTHVQGRF